MCPRRSGPGSAWVIPAQAGIHLLFRFEFNLQVASYSIFLKSQISNSSILLFSLLHSTQRPTEASHFHSRPRRYGPGPAWVIPAKAGIQVFSFPF